MMSDFGKSGTSPINIAVGGTWLVVATEQRIIHNWRRLCERKQARV